MSYDAAGRPVEGKRQKPPHEFRTGGDGTSEVDPDDVAAELAHIVDVLATERLQGRIRGVALDTFASRKRDPASGSSRVSMFSCEVVINS
jgi:gluconokinase